MTMLLRQEIQETKTQEFQEPRIPTNPSLSLKCMKLLFASFKHVIIIFRYRSSSGNQTSLSSQMN